MEREIFFYLDGRPVLVGAFEGEDVLDMIMHACLMLSRWDMLNNIAVLKNGEVVEDHDESCTFLVTSYTGREGGTSSIGGAGGACVDEEPDISAAGSELFDSESD